MVDTLDRPVPRAPKSPMTAIRVVTEPPPPAPELDDALEEDDASELEAELEASLEEADVEAAVVVLSAVEEAVVVAAAVEAAVELAVEDEVVPLS